MLARVSHELRAPLHTILGSAEMLESTNGASPEVARIRASARYLADLVDDLLDIARIESRGLPLDRRVCSVDAVIADALAVTPSDSVPILLRGAPGLLVDADHRRLVQILVNLLTNAVRHAPEGTQIVVDRVARGAVVEIAVVDGGPGVIPVDRDRIFEPFVTNTGIGLGLTISRGLAEAMGGSLTLRDPDTGAGATFVVQVPHAGGSESASAPEVDELGTVRPLRILSVEDDSLNVELLESVLGTREAVEVEQAPTVAAGLEAVRRRPPDLILLDMHLADGTGADFIDRLRADEAMAAIPVVVLTADATSATAALVAERGARLLTKPFEMSQLLEVVDETVRTAGLGSSSSPG